MNRRHSHTRSNYRYCSTYNFKRLVQVRIIFSSSSSLAQQPQSVKACLYPLSEVSLVFSDL